MIKSRPNNINYIDNYDRIFNKKSSGNKLPKEPTIQTIEKVDNAILDRTRKALRTISTNPDLTKNPIIMMAVDHIHEELQLVNEQLKALDKLDIVSPIKFEEILVEAPASETKQLVETDKVVEASGKGKLRFPKLEKKY